MTVTQLGYEASVVCLTNDFAEEQEQSVLCQKNSILKLDPHSQTNDLQGDAVVVAGQVGVLS